MLGAPQARETRILDAVLALLPAPGIAAWLFGAALAGGLARGFSGFGAAMIFVPLAAGPLGPRAAAPLMLLLEVLAIIGLTRAAWRLADRRETGWLVLGSLFGAPFGVLALSLLDPLLLRWLVAGVIVCMVGLIASGWKFRGRPRPSVALGAGMVGGLLAGAAMIGGPPAMTYLLGRNIPAARIRAAFALYLAGSGICAGIGFLLTGLIGPALVGPLLVTALPYGFGTWAGARMFGLASEAFFRVTCQVMIALAALLSLPAWDGLFRGTP
jgi:uncharacterized membrane protein YfcA